MHCSASLSTSVPASSGLVLIWIRPGLVEDPDPLDPGLGADRVDDPAHALGVVAQHRVPRRAQDHVGVAVGADVDEVGQVAALDAEAPEARGGEHEQRPDAEAERETQREAALEGSPRERHGGVGSVAFTCGGGASRRSGRPRRPGSRARPPATARRGTPASPCSPPSATPSSGGKTFR